MIGLNDEYAFKPYFGLLRFAPPGPLFLLRFTPVRASGTAIRDRYSGTAIQAFLRLTPVPASGTAIRDRYSGAAILTPVRASGTAILTPVRASGTAIPGRLFIGLHWQLSDHQIPSVFLSRNMARAEASKAELALY